ncbi:uncharacterized protein EAF01_002378 [Botrytis porri]|uniref:uncharacterized protein n=1 Tax=Botrytis porri TaxID=87229 RepID=UPI001901DF6C|nr:uncharacterized protein EAF01_002378 [Botrytis porri]KAF7910869.1 hypothetical protein EAF01_002378 [Botrytis porri]
MSTTIPETMRAIMLSNLGPPSSLKIETIPTPNPPTWPSTDKILGIECVGTVAAVLEEEEDGGKGKDGLKVGDKVATFRVEWVAILMVDMRSFVLYPGHKLRGLVGAPSSPPSNSRKTILSSSAAEPPQSVSPPQHWHPTSTTRQPSRTPLLLDTGAHHVLIDLPSGLPSPTTNIRFDTILELVGPTTLDDSFQLLRTGGVLCQAGICGGKWILENWSPFAMEAEYFTSYASSVERFLETSLDSVAGLVRGGKIRIPIRVFEGLGEIVEARRVMEVEGAAGKIVVVV